jgi:hypothetical protein
MDLHVDGSDNREGGESRSQTQPDVASFLSTVLHPDYSQSQSSDSPSLAAPYLSVPTRDEPDPPIPTQTTQSSPAPTIRKDRLYIGNLHPSVDEYAIIYLHINFRSLRTRYIRYALLQLFQKYGRIAHLDFLFHRTGALRGKPRGYAFLEYVDKEVRPILNSSPNHKLTKQAGRSQGPRRTARQALPRSKDLCHLRPPSTRR